MNIFRLCDMIDKFQCPEIKSFRITNYLVIIDDYSYIFNGTNKVVPDRIDSISYNAPCRVDGELCALWDMRNNFANWDIIDVFCGILHEMIHCLQIKNCIWKYCVRPKNMDFVPLRMIKKCCIEEDFSFLPREYRDVVIQEGAALYFELFIKSKLRNEDIELLLDNYELFAKQYKEYLIYLYGAAIIYFQNYKGCFDFDRYLIGGCDTKTFTC